MKSKVLVVVDMQNDFIDGSLGTKEALAIVPKVKAKILEYEKAGYNIIFTRDTHNEDYLETKEGEKLPVTHCIKDTNGWNISSELSTGNAMIVDKPTFGSTKLATLLTNTDSDIEFIGLCTDICVISNALLIKAFLPEANIIVDASCCAGVTPESHKNALAAMRMCHINIINEEDSE